MGVETFKPTIPRLLVTCLILTLVVGLSLSIGIYKQDSLPSTSYSPVISGSKVTEIPTPALGIRPRVLRHPFWTPVIIYRNSPNSHLGLVAQDWLLATPYWIISSYLLACLLLSLAPRT